MTAKLTRYSVRYSHPTGDGRLVLDVLGSDADALTSALMHLIDKRGTDWCRVITWGEIREVRP